MKTIIAAAIAGVLVAGCGLIRPGQETVDGSGKLETKALSVDAFNQIESKGIFDIIVEQGDENTVTVTADDNIMPYFRYESNGKTLVISSETKANLKPTRAEVHITVDRLLAANLTGTGNFSMSSWTQNKPLDINNSGTGDVNVVLNLKKLVLNNTGTGDVELSGSSKILDIENTGTGDVFADKMRTGTTTVVNSGTGDVKVWAEDHFSVNASGTGDVFCKGNPKVDRSSNTGTGKVHYNS